MLKRSKQIKEITRWFAILQTDLNLQNANHYFDGNTDIEYFFQRVLNIIFDWKLINLNTITSEYPAIDLGDADKRIAVQVTTESNKGKINKTISKFIAHKLNEDYDTLYFVIINDKKQYRDQFKDEEKINFTKNNIFFTQDVIKAINALDDRKLEELHKYIESQTSIINDASSKDIEKLLQAIQGKVDDETASHIYEQLSYKVINGYISDVINIVPLIEGKNESLEMGIKHLVALFSGRELPIPIYDLERKVSIEEIYADLIRKTIFYSNYTKSTIQLDQISDRNKYLYEIAQCLIAGKFDKLFSVDKEYKNGIVYFKFTISEKFRDELWLVKRLCIDSILNTNVINASSEISEMLDCDENIIDRIQILGRKTIELASKSDPEEAHSVYLEIRDMENLVNDYSDLIKTDYYIAAIRCALYYDRKEAKKVFDRVPNNLKQNVEIEMLGQQVALDNDELDEEELLTVSMKNDQYWVLNNYLISLISDSKRIEAMIKKHLFIIDKDPTIFLLYVQVIYSLHGKEKAVDLLLEYEDNYQGYFEFWIDWLRIDYSDELLNSVIEKWKQEKLAYISYCGFDEFLKILVAHKRYEEVLSGLNTREKTCQLSPNELRIKGIALMCLKREVEALSLFNILFPKEFQDESIVEYILRLSLTNNRTVRDDVIQYAIKSQQSSVLSLVAQYYDENNDKPNARKYNLMALIREKDDDDPNNIYGQFFGLNMSDDSFSSDEITLSGLNIVIYLQNEDNAEKRVLCPIQDDVLPSDYYEWENLVFISKNTAIKNDLFSKPIGAKVQLDDIAFSIVGLECLQTLLLKKCQEKLLKKGMISAIKIPLTDTGKLDVVAFAEELKKVGGDTTKTTEWIESYKESPDMPPTFFLCSKGVSTTYSQTIREILNNEEIIYREFLSSDNLPSEGEYILTYTALVDLYILDYHINNKGIKITQSAKNTLKQETEKIIEQNAQEFNGRMGVHDDKLFFVESTSDEKSREMKWAVGLQEFAQTFDEVESNSDLVSLSSTKIEAKEILGPCDAEAFAYAMENDCILVCAEEMVSAMASLSGFNIKRISIADFIARSSCNIYDVLSMAKKMFQLKFAIPITLETIKRIISFTEADENGTESIVKSWDGVLSEIPNDSEYRRRIFPLMCRIVSELEKSDAISNPIARLLMFKTLEIGNMRLRATLNQDGTVTVDIVSHADLIGDEETV